MEKSSRPEHQSAFLPLTILILFHIINNYIWLTKNSALGFGDTSLHLYNSLSFFEYLKSGEGNFFSKLFHLFNGNNIIYRFWPPFVYLVSAGLRFAFGNSVLAVKLSTSSLYFIILILSVYFLGYYYRNQRTGILSSFLVSMYVGIFGISREYFLDFPLVAMVSLCMLFLLKSDKFKNRLYSLIFGLCFGIGLLTKTQVVFFILPVAIYFLVVQIEKNSKEKVKNFLFALSSALMVTSIWFYGFWAYKPDKWSVKNAFLSSFFSTMQGKAVNYTLAKEFFPVVAEGSFIPKISNLSNWAYYFEAVFLYVTPLLALVFIFSTYLLYKSKKLEKELFIWIIFPYFIFSLLSPKDARYFFPVFPAIALLTALGIEELKNRIFKNIALVLLFTFGITNYYAYSYLGCDLFIKYRLETKQSLFYIHPPFKNNYYSVVIKFLKEIEKRVDLSQTNIGLISPGGEFDLKGETSIVTYYLASYKPAFSWSNSTKAGFLNDYKKYNYLIVISDPVVFKPDFRQLLAKNGSLNTGNKLTTKEKADDAIKYFETFRIIKRDILQGFDKKDIFLISKD